jgi:hypothetical protein
VELLPGGLLHFGASSRRYQLRHAAPPQPPSTWQQPQQPQQATSVSPSRKRRAEVGEANLLHTRDVCNGLSQGLA